VKAEPKPTPIPPQRFDAAPLDPYALRVTTGLAYLGGLLLLPLLFAYLANLRWDGLLVPVALAIALALFLLLSYAFQPQAYELSSEHLIVRRRLWRALRLPLSEISAASPATNLADVPRRGLRFAFNAGIFGYQGPFHLDPYGQVFFIATNTSRLVALARQGRTALIVSPDRPRAFIETLNTLRTQQALEELDTEEGKPEVKTCVHSTF
jgi:hypothetical protein